MIPIASRVGGTVLKVSVVDNQVVEAGAVLVEIDPRDFQVAVDKARAELRRISGRRRATDELTESEHRVALLAAAGRSNKHIAAELFMSVHTVGAHLSRAYRKLGIRSRAELADELAKRTSGPTKAVNEAAKL